LDVEPIDSHVSNIDKNRQKLFKLIKVGKGWPSRWIDRSCQAAHRNAWNCVREPNLGAKVSAGDWKALL
jgi:hypothetical protein